MTAEQAFQQAYSLAIDYVKKTLKGAGALKGKDGFSPIITENPQNTKDVYKLDITTADGTFTTPDLKGDDGEGASKIDSIKINNEELSIADDKSVNIPIMGRNTFGVAKLDGETITVDENGVLSAAKNGDLTKEVADTLYGDKEIYNDTTMSLGRKVGTTKGSYSAVVGGQNNQATGTNSVVLGGGSDLHDSGNVASGVNSIVAGGYGNKASGERSVVIGGGGTSTPNKASGSDSAVLGGYSNTASGSDSAVVGGRDSEATSDHSVVVGGRSNHALTNYSAVFSGYGNESNGQYSSVMGGTHNNTSESYSSVVGGTHNGVHSAASSIVGGEYNSIFSGVDSFIAGGYNNTMKLPERSFIIGGYENTISNGTESETVGRSLILAGYHNHIADSYSAVINGFVCEGIAYSLVTGHYNDTSKGAEMTSNSGTGSGTVFEIGNGTSSTNSNAIRVDYNGKLWCKAAYSSSGADYAELFEWEDGNLENEKRIGYFVTMKGKKIKKANAGDWILGIVSANPCVLGNSDMEWQGQFMRDEFNAYIIEHHKGTVMEVEPVLDDKGNPVIDKETGKPITQEVEKEIEYDFYKVNPDYDPKAPYIDRLSRPEWDATGMMGVLSVWDDGSCKVDGFCTCGYEGVATASEYGYRVIERVSDNIIKVVINAESNSMVANLMNKNAMLEDRVARLEQQIQQLLDA